MRKFLIGVAALLALLVATALVGPNLVDWNSYKAEILAQAKAATGRDLSIDGNIDFSVFPGLQLTAANVRIANIKGGSAADMVRLKSLDLQVRLLPLLQGRIEAGSITLLEPEIQLERLADGRANWELAPPKTNASPSDLASTTPGDSSGSTILRGIRLDNVLIRRGTVIYRDAISGVEERIAGLAVQVGVRSLNGPFRAKGDVILRGVPVSLDAAIGILKPTDPAPVNIQVTVPSAGTRLDLSGGAVITGAAPRFTGKLTVSGKDMRRLAAAISGRSRNTLPSALAQPFLVKARLKATQKGGTIENIDVELGGARASGAISFAAGKRFRAAATLRLNRIDLDEWIKTANVATGEQGAQISERQGRTGSTGSDTPALGAATDFGLPDMDATLDARIDAITYNRQNLRNISVKASLADRIVRLNQASVLLPGGGEASASGQLLAQGGRPTYRGKLDGQADNLRAVLNWLGADVRSVPASRLRKFAFSAAVSGDNQQLQILETKISIDTTRVDGGVTIALRERVAFGATINVDNLDLDAYRISPVARNAPSPSSAAGAARNATKPAPETVGNYGSGSAVAAPFSVLNDFDANLRFRIGRLITQQVPIRDLRLEGTLLAGELKIRNASVSDVGGARGAVSGTLNNFAGIPIFKGTISADAKDAKGLFKLAGIAPTAASRSLGALRLRGNADTAADRIKLDLSLAAAGAKVTLAGTAAGFDKVPKIDALVTVDHKNLAQLARTFGSDVSSRNLGPLKVSANLKGGLNNLVTAVRVNAVGGVMESKGTIGNLLVGPAYDLQIKASHPSVADLARNFAPNYRPAGGKIGLLTVNANIKGTQSRYTLSALTAKAGKVALEGSGQLQMGGDRPVLTATLKGNEIDLNPFLPPTFKQGTRTEAPTPAERRQAREKQVNRVQRGRNAPNASNSARSGPGQRFSSAPFDLSLLGLMDATLSVGASSLIYRQFRVDNPVIEGSVQNNKLTIKKIAGKMFDGSFNLVGSLNGRQVPALDGTVSVTNANVGKALFQAQQFDIQGGITDLSMKIAGVGTSPNALIRSLDGSGSISSKNGIVKGFDLKAVSDRLKNLDNAIDFLSLFNSSMQGGQTRFSSLSGTFQIENGLVKNNDLRLVAEGGEARAAGTADLPRWHMDFNGQFRLTEHAKAPPFGMRAVGPIDNPNRIFKFDKLQAYLLQRGIGTLLRKVFPGGRPRSASQKQQKQPLSQPQEQQPRKPRLEDLIPSLLKGLGR